jgi:hypothetical protein
MWLAPRRHIVALERFQDAARNLCVEIPPLSSCHLLDLSRLPGRSVRSMEVTDLIMSPPFNSKMLRHEKDGWIVHASRRTHRIGGFCNGAGTACDAVRRDLPRPCATDDGAVPTGSHPRPHGPGLPLLHVDQPGVSRPSGRESVPAAVTPRRGPRRSEGGGVDEASGTFERGSHLLIYGWLREVFATSNDVQ